jgi:Flp pilus assembly protein TadD
VRPHFLTLALAASALRPLPAPGQAAGVAPGARPPAATSAAPAQATSASAVEAARWTQDGFQQMREGHYREAVAAFNRAVVLDPGSKQARFGLGTAYIQMGRYKEAVSVLTPMTEEFPTDYSLRNNLAWVYATAKDPSVRNGAQAVRFAQEALLIAPEDFHVWSTLAEGYYVLGDYEKALRAAQQAVRLSEMSGSGPEVTEDYRRQVQKSQRAVQAMSVLE